MREEATWVVTFADGTYRYHCDAPWKITFAAGKGTYRSDAHKRLGGSFRVVAASSS